LLVVGSLQPSDAAAPGNLLATNACDIVAAGEPQAVAGVPRQSVDLLVSVGRWHGSFVVTAIEDATGTQLFACQDGRFQRRAGMPSFARAVHEAGYREALSSVPCQRVRPAATYRSGPKTRYVSGLYLVLTALKCGGFCGPEPSGESGLLKGRLHERQARFGHSRDGGERRAWVRG